MVLVSTLPYGGAAISQGNNYKAPIPEPKAEEEGRRAPEGWLNWNNAWGSEKAFKTLRTVILKLSRIKTTKTLLILGEAGAQAPGHSYPTREVGAAASGEG